MEMETPSRPATTDPRLPVGPPLCACGLVAMVLTSAGCLTRAVPPTMRVVPEAIVTERTDRGLVMQIDIVAANTSNEPLPLKDIVYRVDVGGERVFTGRRSAETTLRSAGEQTISLPVVIDQAWLETHTLTAPSTFTISGSIVYLVRGPIAEMLFDAGLRRPTELFSGEGTVVSR